MKPAEPEFLGAWTAKQQMHFGPAKQSLSNAQSMSIFKDAGPSPHKRVGEKLDHPPAPPCFAGSPIIERSGPLAQKRRPSLEAAATPPLVEVCNDPPNVLTAGYTRTLVDGEWVTTKSAQQHQHQLAQAQSSSPAWEVKRRQSNMTFAALACRTFVRRNSL